METAHLQRRVPGGGEPPRVICRLSGVFLKKSCYIHARESKLKDTFLSVLQNCLIQGYLYTFFFSFTVNRKEQHSWHIHQIHPKATENVIFKFVLLAVCFQKWTWLSKVQHHLSAVQKQKSSSYIFHFCNKTEFSHCHFKHPTDLIVISLACSDSVFAYLHR